MKKWFRFIIRLARAAQENGLLALAAELSYKLIFALFPFLLFMMPLVGLFHIRTEELLERMAYVLPAGIPDMLRAVLAESAAGGNTGVLSAGLLVSAFSASSGFNAVIRGINKAYRVKETRSFWHVRLVALLMVFVFALAVVASLLLLIFGDGLYVFLTELFGDSGVLRVVFGTAGYLVLMLVLLFAVILIYKFSGARKVSVYDVFPGAFTTLIVWVAASKGFNVYVNHFSGHSRVYGSIAGVFLLMLWLNLIAAALLLGGEVNALLKNEA